ncbi:MULTISPECIES: ABC transporter substrate-binding protein [unclassified Rathayibacter]|uniref:ABC transporter substrate-binding protein n=1 Tax=unclassified Rathayibacter TaxID=2609250 RepID=UPI0010487B8A|nr:MULTISPECIES: ABC transporter substrate-binding protein [unclassified Rathayibacter]TCL82978.1 iron complex transport system substrate-binding protein [Rathayibacter sp. PhB192]TCM28475.1 iron complex transport system substrate-binding protein [Rathayibacter sp. PhB179]
MHRTSSSRIPLLIAGLAAASVALAGCSSGASGAAPSDAAAATIVVENAKPTLTLVEEDGEQSYQEDTAVARTSVEVPASPSAVVTFDIATLALHTIGAGDAVVAIPDATLPEYLAEYADLPKVGTLFEPDFEAVAELEPDLIVTAARSTGQYDELSEIATTIDLTGSYAGTFDPAAALERATQLGEIFDREEEVAAQAAATEQLAATIEDRADGSALVLSVSGGEYSAFGEGSRFGYFFDDLGFTPAVAAAELPGTEGSPHGDTVTNEFLLTAAPEWIFAFDRGAATGAASTAEATLDNALVAQTPAAQNDRIVQLPASELYIVINGLTAVQNVLESVHDAMQS